MEPSTPRNMKRRFDTHFYVAVLPPSLAPVPQTTADAEGAVLSQTIGSSDGKETVSADWLTPAAALRLALASSTPTVEVPSIILFPPQFYLLAELAGIMSWRNLVDPSDADAEGTPKVPPFYSASSLCR